ncbi:MAG TPA: GxxExxY protein [Spirochaetia bacterium]|nr:GxxExxY protein [Spirochaetia bacterium]
MSTIVLPGLSHQILGSCFAVHNALGSGLLESAYVGALCAELRHRGIPFAGQSRFPLVDKGELIGDYIADLVAADGAIVGIKSVPALTSLMAAQLLNYLHLAGLPLGYLVNFHGQRLIWKRFASAG